MKKKIKNSQVILTARDMLNGYVANSQDYNIYNMTPLQMVPSEEKDEDWKKWNLDWLERAGLRQLSKEQKKLRKNYNLANGVLDQSDYVIGPENDLSEMISIIADDNLSNIPIKFYPIIPNVVNVLVGEFSKRDNRMIVKAVDETSVNEAYEYKMNMLTEILTTRAQQKKMQQLMEMGMLDSEDPEVQQQVQSEMETTAAIAEAEVKFKNFRGIAEQWGNHIIQLDNDRFDMYQKEIESFRDMLICDREFWHIRLRDDDYEVELWNPINTFYHKSPDVYYISESNYVGNIKIMSIPDVIDIYGDKMTEEQLLNLKDQYRLLNNYSLVTDGIKDQENWYTNFSKPYGKGNYTNVTWQKYLDSEVGKAINGDVNALSWHDLSKRGNSIMDFNLEGPGMVRVTEAYWKSQKRVGHLTRIKKDGTLIQEIVTEDYVITEKPVYDTSLIKNKSKETLIYGEHIDWIWVNEVRWGVKINSSLSTYYTRNYSDFEPIYLGGDPTPYQFRGRNNLYGCRLPVEGKIFSEKNSTSSSLVEKMKPNQINFNIVNNQIVEMLADEVGNVLVFDQNMIPRNSMNGQWGQYNFPMFYQVMKDYQIAPVDPSIRNTESATNFAHFQSIDMSKTNQIASRIELARHFKEEAYAVVGITPQRLGNVTASETATGTNQAINNSYAQTEPYFDQHMNHLMPRVRQLMLEAAQFINSTKPQSRVNYLNSNEENVLFEILGSDLLLRDLRVYAKSTANVKATVEKLQQLAIQNNTAGGSLYDLARILTLNSPAEIISKLKEAEGRRMEEMQAQRDHEEKMMQEEMKTREQLEQAKLEREDFWKEKEIEKDKYVAEVRSLGFSQDADVNDNNVPDILEVEKIRHMEAYDSEKLSIEQEKLKMKREEMASKERQHAEALRMREKEIKSREKIQSRKPKN